MPLQLVEFQKTPTEEDKDRSTIQIKKDNLDKVLDLCGDRPLCVICICGPSRQGKSFILGHMIRCFDATQGGVDDWMDWASPKKPLDKGFTWQNAYGPVTQGIWMWEKPFILKSAEGKECAVLLIDTQGTYDEFTSNRDMTAIVGLSLLMSSVMIFNFFTNLQEDILSSLGTYIEYGLLALDDSDSEKPFQKLKFLIRDWNNPTEFPFGKKGGEQFIKKKLELKDNQPESAQKVRKTIKKCFQELACFLMPAIGDKALAKDYDGNIAALNKSFANKMAEFITELVSGELVVKRIVGSDVTAKELRTFIYSYVDTFNSSTIPSAMSMWEATTLVANKNTLEKAQKVYQEEMKRLRRGKKYLNPNAFKDAHAEANEVALQFFDKAKKYGDNIDSFRTTLTEFIEKELTVNEADNQTKRTTLLNNVEEEAREAFQDGFISNFKFKNDEDFWEEDFITKEANKTKGEVLEEFRDAMADETEEEIEKKVESLEKSFDEGINSVKLKNQLNQMKAEEKIGDLLEDGLDKYKQEMKKIVDNAGCEDVDALNESSDEKKNEILEEFDSSKKPGEGKFLEKFRNKLEESIIKEWDTIKLKFDLKQKEMTEDAEKVVQDLVKEYKKYLDQATQEKLITPESEETLKSGHKEDLIEYQQKLEDGCPFGESSSQMAKLKEKLEDEFEAALEKALDKVKEYNKKIGDKCKEEVKKAGNWYRKEMERALEDEGYLPEDELSTVHGRVKKEAMEKMKNDNTTSEAVDISSYEEELEEIIDSTFEDIEKANKKHGEMAFAQAKSKMTETLEDYKETLTKVVETLNFDKGVAPSIQEDHEKARKEAESKINETCSRLDDEKRQEIVDSLMSAIEKAYEEQKNAVKLKELEMKSAIRDVLDEARKYYHGEMQKNIDKKVYMEPEKLHQHHQKTLNSAVTLHGKELKDEHKAELKTGLEQSYMKYKEENDMKFNSEAKELAIGIDLGTTYCCVAAYFKGDVQVVKIPLGRI